MLAVCQWCVTNLAAAAVVWKMEEYDKVYTYLESGTHLTGLFSHSRYHFYMGSLSSDTFISLQLYIPTFLLKVENEIETIGT
jgi:hypothetical protein